MGVGLGLFAVLGASQPLLLRFVAFGAGPAFAFYGSRCLYDALRGRIARWFEDFIYIGSR